MKIDNVKVGEEYELEGRILKTKEPCTVRFRVLEVGWFPSSVRVDVSFLGIKAQLIDPPDVGGEGELVYTIDFLMFEFANKVE